MTIAKYCYTSFSDRHCNLETLLVLPWLAEPQEAMYIKARDIIERKINYSEYDLEQFALRCRCFQPLETPFIQSFPCYSHIFLISLKTLQSNLYSDFLN